MRGKKPLSENHVKSLRKLVEGNELHELLLNLGVDLMLRGSDLLNLKVSDVLNESGTVKREVRVKMKKTGKTTLNLPLSTNSTDVIKKYLVGRDRNDFIFTRTSFLTEPDSFRTSDTFRLRRSEARSIKSTPKFRSSS